MATGVAPTTRRAALLSPVPRLPLLLTLALGAVAPAAYVVRLFDRFTDFSDTSVAVVALVVYGAALVSGWRRWLLLTVACMGPWVALLLFREAGARRLCLSSGSLVSGPLASALVYLVLLAAVVGFVVGLIGATVWRARAAIFIPLAVAIAFGLVASTTALPTAYRVWLGHGGPFLSVNGARSLCGSSNGLDD